MAETKQTKLEERLKLHEEGDSLAIMREYYETVYRMVRKCGNIRQHNSDFVNCKTDFERVCLLLKLFQNRLNAEKKREAELKDDNDDNSDDDDEEEDNENSDDEEEDEPKGIKVLSLPKQLKTLVSDTEKDDKISLQCLEKGREYEGKNDMRNALKYITYSLFYAETVTRKAATFFERGKLFQKLNYFGAAINDLKNADAAYNSKDLDVQKSLAGIFLKMQKYTYALTYLRKANKLLKEPDDYIKKNIMLCEENRNLKQDKLAETWYSYHPEPPQSLITLSEKKKKTENEPADLPSLKDDPLKFKNTKSERGWILEAKRDISVGEVILTEKPYATVLNNPRTTNCYYCHKRCLNLQPCSKCPYVGFCNDECEKYAMGRKTSNRAGPGRHTYECNGILPYLLIDQISSRPETDPSYTGFAGTCHLAYRTIANTHQETLIDYITRSGHYKNNGLGHQAFKTSTAVRAVPPPMRFVSSDYSSIAWLDPCTESRSPFELWQKTMAAVFLTYCLSVSGYAMSWFEDDFYSAPDADHRPEVIPASWVAACILYHLQALTINCHNNSLLSSTTSKMADMVMEPIATSVYPTYSLINHSCSPNAVLLNTAQGGIFVFALHPISKNSEITVSYLCSCYSFPTSARRSALKYQYLFECNCEACRGLWYEESLSKIATLKCPQCPTLFDITEGVCTSCRSSKAFKEYKTLTKQTNLLFKKSLTSPINWPEEIVKGTQAWCKILDLLQPRGMAFTSLRTGYLNFILQRCGNTVIEPYEKRSNFA